MAGVAVAGGSRAKYDVGIWPRSSGGGFDMIVELILSNIDLNVASSI